MARVRRRVAYAPCSPNHWSQLRIAARSTGAEWYLAGRSHQVRCRGREAGEAYFRLADFTAALTISFADGAAERVLGTAFFGFLASRFPRFFSEAMINLL